MEKTKSELYMERLQKWRREKEIKQKENKQKVANGNLKQGSTVRKTSEDRRRTITHNNKPLPFTTKRASENRRTTETLNDKTSLKTKTSEIRRTTQTFSKSTLSKTKPSLPKPEIRRTTQTFSRSTLSKTKPSLPKPVSVKDAVKKDVKRATTEKNKTTASIPTSSRKQRENDFMHKFQQWKQDKEKTKSEVKVNTCTSHTKNPTEQVKARSHLVFCQKTKQDEENKTIRNTRIVSGIKRRHSVSTTDGPPVKRKPAGILKRKSCVGSLDFKMAADTGTEVEEKCEEVCKTMMPVTPRNVRFRSPENAENKTGGTIQKKNKQNLRNWLTQNNRTPSKFRHLLCFHDHGTDSEGHQPDPVQAILAKSNLTVDELSEQANVLEDERMKAEAMEKLETMLEECMILFDAGCPQDAILPWLDDIYKKIPEARMCVKFYKCKVDVLKSSLDLDAVLQVFEEATINDAKPKTELARILTETLKFITDEKVKQAKKSVRSKSRSNVQEENVFMSSAIVYAVGNATPLSDRKRPSEGRRKSQECRVVTPVRRSTRRSLQNLPDSLKDRRTLSSLKELGGTDNVLYQANLALEYNNMMEAADDEI